MKIGDQDFKKVRWCKTHNCQHYIKDACTRRMIALAGRHDGAVGLGEQVQGPKECVEEYRLISVEPVKEPV